MQRCEEESHDRLLVQLELSETIYDGAIWVTLTDSRDIADNTQITETQMTIKA